VVQLRRWGLLDEVLASGAPAIRDVIFHDPAQRTGHTVKDRHGVDCLVAPRRHILDWILADAARRAGACVLDGTVVDGLTRRGGAVAGVVGRSRGVRFEASGRIVVGADGVRSRIARGVGAPLIETHPASGAVHYAYYRGDWPAMEYFIGDGSMAGIFPTHDGDACVWVCSPAASALAARRASTDPVDAFLHLVDQTHAGLRERLGDTRRASPVHGVIGLPNHLRQPVGDGWALVGDAGYHRDAITGHGISDAFRDAELLATALDRAWRGDIDQTGALASYHRQRDELAREIFDLTVAFVEYPPAERTVELQRQLGRAIEKQAAQLAAWPEPPAPGARAGRQPERLQPLCQLRPRSQPTGQPANH
jgi:flavin-dependent dehydrogenase